MRNRRGRSGVSTGTMVTLVILALVAAGCAMLFPRLLGRVDQRVSPQQVGVALEQSFSAFSDSVLNRPTQAPRISVVTAAPAATPSPSQALTPEPVKRITITAAGELSIDRSVQASCETDTGYNFDTLFTYIKPHLTSDINLATLYSIVLPGETLTDVNMPAAAVSAIAGGGFNVLSTGFYGALDGGLAGLQSTIDVIAQHGMLPYGTYLSAEERGRVVTKDVNGVQIAFLSFQSELSADGKRAATKDEQAYVYAPLTLPAITAEIAAARQAGAKIVVVSLCWGREDAETPTKLQTELAHGIAAAGADIIVGTNPGVLQPVEIIASTDAQGNQRQTLCAYSLGNIIDSDRRNRAVISTILLHTSLRYTPQTGALAFETITYTPVYLWRATYQPVIANEAPPAAMDGDQQGVMGRVLGDIRDVFANSLIQER